MLGSQGRQKRVQAPGKFFSAPTLSSNGRLAKNLHAAKVHSQMRNDLGLV